MNNPSEKKKHAKNCQKGQKLPKSCDLLGTLFMTQSKNKRTKTYANINGSILLVCTGQ